VFLLPTWSLLHSRHWKMQIPYFARHFRVLAMDGLGNGRAVRCRNPQRYGPGEFARDCLAVLDASGTERAVMVALARGAVPAGAGAARPGAGRRCGVRRSDVPVYALALVSATASAFRPVVRKARPSLPLVGADERVSLEAGLRGVLRVVHLALPSWAALHQGDRGRGRMGAGHRPRDADRDGARAVAARP
jgi:pimeloyl-ACP methyl ester carboxylesterase